MLVCSWALHQSLIRWWHFIHRKSENLRNSFRFRNHWSSEMFVKCLTNAISIELGEIGCGWLWGEISLQLILLLSLKILLYVWAKRFIRAGGHRLVPFSLLRRSSTLSLNEFSESFKIVLLFVIRGSCWVVSLDWIFDLLDCWGRMVFLSCCKGSYALSRQIP